MTNPTAPFCHRFQPGKRDEPWRRFAENPHCACGWRKERWIPGVLYLGGQICRSLVTVFAKNERADLTKTEQSAAVELSRKIIAKCKGEKL